MFKSLIFFGQTWSYWTSFLRSLKSRSCREIIPETGARRLGSKPGHVWWPFEDFPRKTNDFPIYRYNIFVNDFPTDKNDDFPVGFPYRWFPVGFSHLQMIYRWFTDDFPWFSHDFPVVFPCFPMIFLGVSYGFPMIFPWFSYGFPMFSDDFPRGFLRFSHVFHGFPMVYQRTRIENRPVGFLGGAHRRSGLRDVGGGRAGAARIDPWDP